MLEILGGQIDYFKLLCDEYEVSDNGFSSAMPKLRSITFAHLELTIPRDMEAFLPLPHLELCKLILDINIPASLWANLTRYTGSLQFAMIDSDPISSSLLGHFIRANRNHKKSI